MDDDLLSLDIDTQPANPPRRRRTPGTTTPSTGNLLEESSPFAEIRGSSPVVFYFPILPEKCTIYAYS